MTHIKIVYAVPLDTLLWSIKQGYAELPIKDVVTIDCMPGISAHWLIDDHCIYSLYSTLFNNVAQTHSLILNNLKQDATFAFYAAIIDPECPLIEIPEEVELLSAQNKLYTLQFITED